MRTHQPCPEIRVLGGWHLRPVSDLSYSIIQGEPSMFNHLLSSE